jgi:hypothetical protein
MCYLVGYCGSIPTAYGLWRRGSRWVVEYNMCYAVGHCGGVPPAYGLWRRGLRWVAEYKMCYAVGYYSSMLPLYMAGIEGITLGGGSQILFGVGCYSSALPVYRLLSTVDYKICYPVACCNGGQITYSCFSHYSSHNLPFISTFSPIILLSSLPDFHPIFQPPFFLANSKVSQIPSHPLHCFKLNLCQLCPLFPPRF